MWDISNEITGKTRSNNYSLTHIDVDGKKIEDEKEIAEVLNNHFSSMGEKASKSVGNSLSSPIKGDYWDSLRERTIGLFQFPQVTIGMVKKVIRSLDSKKSCGFDGISNVLLKRLVDVMAPALTYYFDKSLKEGIYPES